MDRTRTWQLRERGRMAPFSKRFLSVSILERAALRADHVVCDRKLPLHFFFCFVIGVVKILMPPLGRSTSLQTLVCSPSDGNLN